MKVTTSKLQVGMRVVRWNVATGEFLDTITLTEKVRPGRYLVATEDSAPFEYSATVKWEVQS